MAHHVARKHLAVNTKRRKDYYELKRSICPFAFGFMGLVRGFLISRSSHNS
jgi:hypothetical protein